MSKFVPMTGVESNWPARIAYRLDADELRRACAYVTGRSARAPRVLWQYDNTLMRIGLAVGVGLSTAPLVRGPFAPDPAWIGPVREADIAVGQRGLSGRLDDVEARIEWREIASVADTGKEFVINRKALRKPIAISKRATPDPAALWQLFDH